MKKRLKFECWNCRRHYSLLIELEGKPKLNVECPYCGEGAIADLAPCGEDVVEVFKGDATNKKGIGAIPNFPVVIPTTQLED